jgi:sec-independent protein translocase protein TatA
MPFSVGPMELILVLAIALIVLGPKRLPEAGRALGKGMREFKDSVSGIGSHDDDDDDEEEGEPSKLPADRTAAPH